MVTCFVKIDTTTKAESCSAREGRDGEPKGREVRKRVANVKKILVGTGSKRKMVSLIRSSYLRG